MATNLLIYPLDYPETISGDDTASSLENTVENLLVQDRDTAVRQAHTRRISGQNEIQNQNRLVKSRTLPVPLTLTGQQTTPKQSVLGTAAFLMGGRSHATSIISRMCEFLYSNKTSVRIGIQTTEPRTYLGTSFTQYAGYFAGGAGLNDDSGKVIEEFNYSKLVLSRWGASLANPRHALAGVGDATIGAFLGGATNLSSRAGDELTYSTKTVVSNATKLASARMTPHNGTSSTGFGWLYGGTTQGFNNPAANLVLTIEQFNFSSKAVAPIGTSLTKAHAVHGAVGSSIKGYISGGWNTSGQTVWYSTDVSRLTYSGQTVNTVSAGLPEARTCQDGAGSGTLGYNFGGDGATTNWGGSKTIDEVSFTTDIFSRIGSQLPESMADQGAVSDYAASLF